MANKDLEQTYQTFNRQLFGGKLPTVGFVPDYNKRFVFRYDSKSSMIVIGKQFSSVNSRQLMDELLHEMVHVKNAQLGIEDHTPNQYHKKEFSEAALDVGLCVLHTSNRGWGVTTSTVDAQFEGSYRQPDKRAEKKREEAYRVAKIHPMTLSKFQREMSEIIASKPIKQYQFKYVCECPGDTGNSVRSGRRPDGEHALNATCNVCGAVFVYEDANASG